MSIKKVTFTKKAEDQLDNIYNYLEQEHSKAEADKFARGFKERLEQVKQNPEMFKASPKSDKIRKGYYNKLTSFFYCIYTKTVRVLLVKDNRMNSTKYD